MIRKYFLLFICLVILLPIRNVSAQDNTDNPVYIIQNGDTLSLIALRFGVSLSDLMNTNHISDPNSIEAGSQLIIPGLKGIQGILVTQEVPVGEDLHTISLRLQTLPQIIIRLNRITSPMEVYAGTSLILPQFQEEKTLKPEMLLTPDQSLLELSVLAKMNPWLLRQTNQLSGSWDILPGEMVYLPSKTSQKELNNFSPSISSLIVEPLPLKQGSTVVIKIRTNQPITLSGSLGNQELQFFPNGNNEYVALEGISAIADPGLVSFVLKGTEAGSSRFQFDQNILVQPGYYGEDPPLEVDPETLDLQVMESEDRQLTNLTQNATPEKMWSGSFKFPIDEPCIRSWFGNRRTYNSGVYRSYHAGVDFGVCADNLNILAPAPGNVVFTGLLNIHGNSTIIDHGWGIYTEYSHQAEIVVRVGDHVETGQIIGIIGATGRVTGPHLHWELRINGVPINPLEWVNNSFP